MAKLILLYFRVPVSGRVGMSNGYHVNLVEGNVGVHLPSVPSGSQSFGEDQKGAGRDHTRGAVVAKTSLVTRGERGATKGAPTLKETASAAQIKHIPSESTVLQLHAWRLHLYY